jgi:dynein assembly factor 3
VIKDVINFETIKFKDRDDIEDCISSWLTCHPFDIEQLRDTRLRAHFGKRYDHRRNLTDWDYNFGIKDFAKMVNQLEYRQFRLTGVAFETRLANGAIPNRTLGSFVEGRKKRGTRDSIMVRGFWGDIINSPYMSFGNEVDDADDAMRFFKQVNFQSIYSNSDISEYNIQKFIYQMEELNEFEYGFERLRHIL